MFCKNCGKEISDNALSCPNCGEPTDNVSQTAQILAYASDREWVVTLLLCFFLGGFGAHSFYARKPIVGIIQLITFGGCGIWVLCDLIMILTKSYRDSDGRLIVR